MKYLQVHTLFLMSVFVISFGQNKTNPSKENINSATKGSITSRVPNGGVFDIKQDRKGIIWIAANNGVYRYDGKSFSNITDKISSARFSSILEDRKGNFWFTTLGSGVLNYDGKSFRNFTTKQGLASNYITCIYEDKHGNIWFGTPGGASRYDGKSFRTLKMTKAGSGPDSVHLSVYQLRLPETSGLNNDVHAITEDKTGKLWFGTRGNTFIYDGKTFTTVNNKDGKAFTNVWCIIKDTKGNIWFGADGLWRYNGSSLTKISQTGAGVLAKDKKGNILASSGGSIFRYDEQTLSDIKPHMIEINTKDDGRKNLPFGILGANDGSIWFASGEGVSRYDGKTIVSFNDKKAEK